jgi:hypothetical protein
MYSITTNVVTHCDDVSFLNIAEEFQLQACKVHNVLFVMPVFSFLHIVPHYHVQQVTYSMLLDR